MKSFLQLITAVLLIATASVSHAQTSVYAVRVTAADPEAVATFYKAAFGLVEAERINLPQGVEIMLNYGTTQAQALASTAPQVVIMSRASDDVEDTVPHLIFVVNDAVAVSAAVKSAGGTIERAAFAFGNEGMMIAMVIDPAGNHLELIQRPR